MALKRGRLSQVERDKIKSLHKQKRKVSTIANNINRSEAVVRKVLGIEEAPTPAPKKKTRAKAKVVAPPKASTPKRKKASKGKKRKLASTASAS